MNIIKVGVKIKARINWIDVAKGFAMLSIVAVHVGVPGIINKYILSFSLPMFFFLSGYFFQIEKYRDFLSFLNKKVKTLALPYFVFGIISYVFWVGIERNSFKGINIFQPLIGLFYSNTNSGYMAAAGPLWYVTCLFVVEMMFYFLVKKIKKNSTIAGGIIIISILGYLDSIYTSKVLPWGADISLTAIFFYGAGYLLKNKTEKIFNMKVKFKIVTLLVNMVVSVVFCLLNNTVEMNINQMGNYLYFYISALAGILSWIIISMFFQNLRIISYYGVNTLIILGLHGKVLIISKFLLTILLRSHYPKSTTLDAALVFVLTLILLIPLISIINNYAPFILGKKAITKNIDNASNEISA